MRVETKLSALDNGSIKGSTNMVMVIMTGQFQVGVQTFMAARGFVLPSTRPDKNSVLTEVVFLET